MKYISKNLKKKIKKIDPLSSIYSDIDKHYTVYSRGGKVERSFKQRIGKKFNKDFDRKIYQLNLYDKIRKNIDDKLK